MCARFTRAIPGVVSASVMARLSYQLKDFLRHFGSVRSNQDVPGRTVGHAAMDAAGWFSPHGSQNWYRHAHSREPSDEQFLRIAYNDDKGRCMMLVARFHVLVPPLHLMHLQFYLKCRTTLNSVWATRQIPSTLTIPLSVMSQHWRNAASCRGNFHRARLSVWTRGRTVLSSGWSCTRCASARATR